MPTAFVVREEVPSFRNEFLVQRGQRVGCCAADAQLEVEVRACRVPGRADEADRRTDLHPLPDADVDLREVRVERPRAAAVGDREIGRAHV